MREKRESIIFDLKNMLLYSKKANVAVEKLAAENYYLKIEQLTLNIFLLKYLTNFLRVNM